MKKLLESSAAIARPIVLAASLTLISLAASADDAAQTEEVMPDAAPSAGAMVFDLVIVRPLGLIATILGSGVFLLQLPLDLIQGKPPVDPAQKLVVEPARYTFDRPLGVMDY
jgi:hypothetical protein